ncbi:hypothetical protein ACWF94_03200 [Streptomyces sp. NPDC055078]
MTTTAFARLRLLPVLLVACVVTLCLTELARPAVAMPSTTMSGVPGSTQSMGMEPMPTGSHQAGKSAAPSVSDVHGLEQSCPMPCASDCAQPSVLPVGGEQTGYAHGFDGPEPAFMQPGPPRPGVPPPLAQPSTPELTRLCVSRT